MLHPLVPPDGYGTRLIAGFDGDVEDHGRIGEGLRGGEETVKEFRHLDQLTT